MKDLFFSLAIIIFLSSCATIHELSSEAIYHALVGQNMRVVGDRLGLPSKILPAPNEEKIMLYEYLKADIIHYSNQSNASLHNTGYNPARGSFYVNPSAKANSMIFENFYRVPENKWLFKIFINNQGYCYKILQNLSPEQMEQYYERFKHYIPNNKQ